MPGRGHRMRAARAIAAACVAVPVAGLFATACDGHSAPRAVDEPTSSGPLATAGPLTTPVGAGSPAGSILPSLTASTFPSAEAQIPAAVQVVRAFFDGLNYEIDNGGNESKLVPLFTGECARCSASASTLHSVFAGGKTIRGGHYHVVSIDKTAATDVARVSVVVTESADPAQVVDKRGEIVQSYPGLQPTQQTFYVAVDRNPPVILAFLLGGDGR